jgi:3-dehydroquinate synthase
MKKIKLDLGEHSSSIFIGKNSVDVLSDLAGHTKIFIISDERLTSARKVLIRKLNRTKIPVFEIPVRAGEELKSIKSIYPLYGELLKLKADRKSLIVALGGGSVGDAVGFVASTYMRGISWIGVPTTLLAQVDSSVGGKTGINHEVGKNLIGSFYQPSRVICDTNFLKTLSEREIISGLGEIVKYSLTFDKKFFKYLEKNLSSLLKLKPDATLHAIKTSLVWKCKAVEKDERDLCGVREVLNFGHTFGHALESITGYKKYQHGEAVIWGMRFALCLSEVRGHLSQGHRERALGLVNLMHVPALPKNLDFERVCELMKKDKKAEGDKIRFVLLNQIGKSLSDHSVTKNDLTKAYKLMKESI